MRSDDGLTRNQLIAIDKREISKIIAILEAKRNDLMTLKDMRKFLSEELTIHDPEAEDYMRLLDKFTDDISESIRSYNEILAKANEHLAFLESTQD